MNGQWYLLFSNSFEETDFIITFGNTNERDCYQIKVENNNFL